MAERKKIIPTKKPPIKRSPIARKTSMSKSKTPISEKKIIFGTAFLVLIIMVMIHLSGCLNELKAEKIARSYIKSKEFGIHMPTLYPINGIDVSIHQGQMNWKLLKEVSSDDIKIDFAFIKASEGRTRVDPFFKYNWEQAEKYGFIRGAYHFFLPNKSGKEQAALFLKTANLEDGDLTAVCDIEITGGADQETLNLNLAEWLDAVEKATGKKPLIYSSKKFYEKYLREEFSDYPLWIAHFNVPGLELESGSKWHFWQHNDKGRVKGIKKNLDFNVFNGSMEELDQLRI